MAPEWNPNTSTPGHYKDPKEIEKERKTAEAKQRAAEAKMNKAQREAYKKEIAEAKGETDKLQAELIMAYSHGEITYTEFWDKQHDTAIDGLQKLQAVYKKYGTDVGQLDDDIAKEQQEKQKDHNKALLSEVEVAYQLQVAQAHEAFSDRSNKMYKDEEALNEALFEAEQSAIADRMTLSIEGSEEWFNLRNQRDENDRKHQIELQQRHAELLEKYREEWGNTDLEQKKSSPSKDLKFF